MNQKALVTAGANGIGLEIVKPFAETTGQTQPRVVKIEGDFLHLSTATPIVSGSKTVNSYLTFKRAAKL